MAYEKEMGYVEREIARGVRQFDRTNSHVQTLLRAAENMSDVARFVQQVGLRRMINP